MAKAVNVSFQMDGDLKSNMEKRIPFEVSADPFYSDSNMVHLRRGVAALNAGEGIEHELIEEE
ncbi:MAG: type II toxin-antitoxin system antitoxin, RelB/DinJ family [Lachnospiraceae bacterium]|nr:type II toxin-antitoxin system antitoxin, RelB/DinJ family [Lachnospiraceae bacterium]